MTRAADEILAGDGEGRERHLQEANRACDEAMERVNFLLCQRF